jgi:CBS domain-containing protein
MVATLDRLSVLTASDLMSRSVVLVPKEMSLCAAARLLCQAHVSGAPVVDVHGRCIGVLSTTDFLHYAETAKSRRDPHLTEAVHAWQIVAEETPSGELVADYMTRDPVTVPPHTPIRQLARMMVDAHIHRIIVVDKEQRPIGIVSSTDILAAVAQLEKPT